MKLVCAVFGDSNVGDYNYAIIEIPEAYADWLLQRLVTAACLAVSESDFYSIEYFDYQASFYRDLDIGQEIEERIFYPMPDDFDPSEEKLRTAATTVIVQAGGVLWRGNPKHSDGEFETPMLSRENIETIRKTGSMEAPIPASG
jgi:hypothetical protein